MTEIAKKEFNVVNFKTANSLFIEASAGTGKTYTIQLMVAKMINEGTPLKKILIVTYTEKAAGELKDRIRKKSAKSSEPAKLTKTRIIQKMASTCLYSKRLIKMLTTQLSLQSTPSVKRP